jgi:hypothetical protein
MDPLDNLQDLTEMTRRMLDLKAKKKEYNKDMNEQIKDVESAIKKLVKEREE